MLTYCDLWPKSLKLNSRPVYCLRLYGNCQRVIRQPLSILVGSHQGSQPVIGSLVIYCAAYETES